MSTIDRKPAITRFSIRFWDWLDHLTARVFPWYLAVSIWYLKWATSSHNEPTRYDRATDTLVIHSSNGEDAAEAARSETAVKWALGVMPSFFGLSGAAYVSGATDSLPLVLVAAISCALICSVGLHAFSDTFSVEVGG